MHSGQLEPETPRIEPDLLILEVADQDDQPPLRIPVMPQTLNLGVVNVVVPDPWVIADWEYYRNRLGTLKVEGSQDQLLASIRVKISWSKFNHDISSPLSLGLHLVQPSEEALNLVRTLITSPAKDVQGLWEKYDQHRHGGEDQPTLMHHFYIAGLVLLLGGVGLQLLSPPPYKIFGWGLWLLGTLGIAGKIMSSLRQKRLSQ
jgi:hypothetical protein